MRSAVIVCAVVFLGSPALSKEPKPTASTPNRFEIGRQTHFDFGPPFNYYEVFIVRSKVNGTSVERVILTPAGDKCFVPAKLETARGSISESIAVFFGSKNPCTIPEKELQHELTRGRHQLVFSFANVVMQVQCGAETRLLHSSILDRDMFDTAPNTPQNTSWTMKLLAQLDRAVGPGVMDKPIFPILAEAEKPSEISDSERLRDLGAGKYDALFPCSVFRLSDLYREAIQSHPSPVSVRLVSSVPTQPEVYIQPEYPPLAKMARVEGTVSFVVEVNDKGGVNNLTFQSGHPLLRAAVQKAVTGWKFHADMISYEIQATIEFALNCTNTTE